MSAQPSGSRRGAVLRRLAALIVLAAGVLGAIGLLAASSRPVAPLRGAPITVVSSRASSHSHSLQSMFQDDRLLVYGSTPTVIRTLDTLRALGVDRLRITVLWSQIAPAQRSTYRPLGFAAADPAAYPEANWAPYDRVLRLARRRKIAVNFDLSAPGPLWAMGQGAPVARQANHFEASAAEFGRFVFAVGLRYSGRYVAPGAHSPLPRVGFWSIWNEPNQPGWLAPQTVTVAGRAVLESARLYRHYVDAAFAALEQTGHRSDAILIGELAPEGDRRLGASRPAAPIPFLQALYCVGRGYRPLVGVQAVALGCPGTGARSAFVAAHPGLFKASGFAHHPYSFFLAPGTAMSDRDFVPLSNLRRLEHGLDGIFAVYSVRRRLPIYLTEYGYETNPPNPFRGVGPDTQAAYLGQAEYMAWRDQRVRSLAQFLLIDSPPDVSYPKGSVGYWSTFQTGLVYLDGRRKPAFSAYRLPIFVPTPAFARANRITVWGMLRSAPDRTAQRVLVQWRSAQPGTVWQGLQFVVTNNPAGVLLTRVTVPGRGEIRLVWKAPTGKTLYSRAVAVQATRG